MHKKRRTDGVRGARNGLDIAQPLGELQRPRAILEGVAGFDAQVRVHAVRTREARARW
jgi:hypothetical protein